jgi:hypothetical protein
VKDIQRLPEKLKGGSKKSKRLIQVYSKNKKIKEFFYFLTCPHKGRGRGIRTCDIRFIRRGSQPIELPLGTKKKERKN